jgi:hypothetical protein
MRSFMVCLFAGSVAILAMGAVASSAGLGWAVGASPSLPATFAGQTVDRTRKGDRLTVPLTTGRRNSPQSKPAVLVGCEPVFSSLSASSRANFSGRCLS